MTVKAARKKSICHKQGPRLVSLEEFWTPKRIAEMDLRMGPPPPGLTRKRIEEFRRIVRESLRQEAADA